MFVFFQLSLLCAREIHVDAAAEERFFVRKLILGKPVLQKHNLCWLLCG